MSREARIILATSLGNALECYDLIIYGTFALSIAGTFFPTRDANTSLLIAFGTFGVSFFFRPLGGLILGSYGDRAGRKAALLVTMSLMLAGTLLIAITPSYATLGIGSSVLVVVGRLLQGFSAGGEFASATAFLAEQSVHRRGFYASWQFASQGFSMLLAAAVGYAITASLSADQVQHGGWRLSFAFGLLIGPALLFARAGLTETSEFSQEPPQDDPIRATFAEHKGRLLIALGSVVVATVGLYVILYMPTYAVRQLQLTQSNGFGAIIVAGVALFFLTPLSGMLADRYSRLRLALVFAALLLVTAVPLYLALSREPSPATLYLVQLVLAGLLAGYLGPLSSLLSDLFPTRTRTTGMSLSYNFSVLLFGGFAPFIMTWLAAATGSAAVPGYYLTAAAAGSLLTLGLAWGKGYR